MPETAAANVFCNVPVPMRDGTILYADVHRPAVGGPFPVLLMRTPYDKSNLASINGTMDILRAVRAGYAVVIQDCRGRYASEGEFYAFVNEAADGYDTVEWCAAQPWSTGKVGMYGRSYVGLTQWQAAIARPPHLAAIIPSITAGNYHEGWAYQGGAFELGFNLSWTLSGLATDTLWRRRNDLPDFARIWADHLRAIDTMPCAQFPVLPLDAYPPLKVAGCAPYYFDWLAHPSYDEYWRRLDVGPHHAEINLPVLHIGAWYDIFLGGTLGNYVGMRENAPSEGARQAQRLIVGPWAHVVPFSHLVGEVDFGRAASQSDFDHDGICLRFFDRWLKDARNGVDDEAPVRVFVMGRNVWRDEAAWPLARARQVPYYLHSGGRANGLSGDGALGMEEPADEPPDYYVYNPRDPVPTRGGALCCYPAAIAPGAYDQRPVEARPDVLVYTTPPLDEPVEVTGPVSVILYAATSAPDTDFTAKLVDVDPSGYARNLTDSIVRARYRESRARASLVTPGVVYEYTIDLWATSNVFLAGHRIRLEISSSNFPRFDRNLNTGRPIASEAETRPALQTIFHDQQRRSRLILPIVPAP